MDKIVQTLVAHQLHPAISDYTQHTAYDKRITITVANSRYTIMESVE